MGNKRRSAAAAAPSVGPSVPLKAIMDRLLADNVSLNCSASLYEAKAGVRVALVATSKSNFQSDVAALPTYKKAKKDLDSHLKLSD